MGTAQINDTTQFFNTHKNKPTTIFECLRLRKTTYIYESYLHTHKNVIIMYVEKHRH